MQSGKKLFFRGNKECPHPSTTTSFLCRSIVEELRLVENYSVTFVYKTYLKVLHECSLIAPKQGFTSYKKGYLAT